MVSIKNVSFIIFVGDSNNKKLNKCLLKLKRSKMSKDKNIKGYVFLFVFNIKLQNKCFAKLLSFEMACNIVLDAVSFRITLQ